MIVTMRQSTMEILTSALNRKNPVTSDRRKMARTSNHQYSALRLFVRNASAPSSTWRGSLRCSSPPAASRRGRHSTRNRHSGNVT